MKITRAWAEQNGLDYDKAYATGKPIRVPSEVSNQPGEVSGGPARNPYPGYPGRWVMEIPGWCPTFDNKLKRVPMAAHRLKKHDANIVGRAALIFGVPAAIGRRRLRLTIRNRFGSFPDDSAPLKSLWDALKSNGLLVDDSRDWLEFVWPPTYERAAKATVIDLEDIESDGGSSR